MLTRTVLLIPPTAAPRHNQVAALLDVAIQRINRGVFQQTLFSDHDRVLLCQVLAQCWLVVDQTLNTLLHQRQVNTLDTIRPTSGTAAADQPVPDAPGVAPIAIRTKDLRWAAGKDSDVGHHLSAE